MPEVQIDGRGRCTVTWLPNFLLWVVKHIVLPMGLRCARLARESSASILTFLAASFYSCSWSPLVFGGDQNIWCFTSDSEALVIKESQIDNNILSEISIRRVPSRTLQRRNRQCFGNLFSPEIFKVTNKTNETVRDNFLRGVANLSGDGWLFFLILLFLKLANLTHTILVFSAILSPVVEILPVKTNSVQHQPVFIKSTISWVTI